MIAACTSQQERKREDPRKNSFHLLSALISHTLRFSLTFETYATNNPSLVKAAAGSSTFDPRVIAGRSCPIRRNFVSEPPSPAFSQTATPAYAVVPSVNTGVPRMVPCASSCRGEKL